MGKSQSKLSADELAELQKNTYCELDAGHTLRPADSPLLQLTRRYGRRPLSLALCETLTMFRPLFIRVGAATMGQPLDYYTSV